MFGEKKSVGEKGESFTYLGGKLIMFLNKRVIGALSLNRSENIPDTDIIEDVFIDPLYQRHGFGKKMMLHALSLSKSRYQRLTILSDNTAALMLYKSLGFVELLRQSAFGIDTITMQRDARTA